MQYNIYDYDNQLLGQIEARDSSEAWFKARSLYGNVLDVRSIAEVQKVRPLPSDFITIKLHKLNWDIVLEALEFKYETLGITEAGKAYVIREIMTLIRTQGNLWE